MEVQASLERWCAIVEQLDKSHRMLRREEVELESLHRDIVKYLPEESAREIQRSLQQQEEVLHLLTLQVKDMSVALEKVRRIYEKCEEDILASGEAETSQVTETLQIIDLEEWKVIPVKLEP